MGSLRRRLVWTLLGLTLFAWLASAGVTYFYANRVLSQQVDQQLEQYAGLVGYVTGVFARQIAQGQPLYESWSGHDYDQARLEPIIVQLPLDVRVTPAVNIWEDGHLIAVVQDSPRFPAPRSEGFESLQADGGTQWRILSKYSEQDAVWIRVGMELGAAREAMLQSLRRSLVPLLIVLPLTVIVLYAGVIRGLQPLHELAAQIARRKPGLLDPVDTEGVPREVAGVVDSLNRLLLRLADALESEQRFTANAAHELLTPLAAIKTEVQLCQRQLQEGVEARMLGRIVERVDRASHSVDQLLTLARLDPDLPPGGGRVALGSLLESVLAESGHIAAERNLEVQLTLDSEAEVTGSEEALAILLRNLVNNAFRYATQGSVVDLRLGADAGVVELSVCNDCEPLSEAEFAQVARRFFRVPGSAGTGSGLGLSIVSRIAQLHGARFSTGPGTSGRGFCARVEFPQPDTSGA